MNSEPINVTPEELARHVAEAQRLRSAEIARLSGRLFRAPATVLRRLVERRAAARTAGQQISHYG